MIASRIDEKAASDFLADLSRLETTLGYDAVENKGRRKLANISTTSEDGELRADRRAQLQSSNRDLARNFAIAAWAIRKHLDFVSRFQFDCSSGESDFDDTLESLMEEDSDPENFDIAARHDRSRWLRIFEARSFVDGDCLAVFLQSGHRQAIEGDRIRTQGMTDANGVTQGVKHDQYGRPILYQIHQRMQYGSFQFEREIYAKNCFMHGYYDRFDQIRGISPLASGLNTCQDIYENFDYALAKAKISQLFGLAFTRDALTAPAPIETDDDDDDDSSTQPRYKVNFGRGPVMLDLENGDDVKIMESQQPSNQFREFTLAMIQVALKALDIPYCFFDESHTNFYGSRAAVTLYIESCKVKRAQLKRFLKRMATWKIRQWVARGRLILPAGMKPETVPCDWIHAGLPWWDPAKEVNADIQSVLGGLRSRREIRRERFGDDWFDVADQLREEEAYAEKIGLRMESVVTPQQPDPTQGTNP